MRMFSKVTTLCVALAAASPASAATLIPVPNVPGSIVTYVTSINDNNVVTGYYRTPDQVSHAFFGTLNGPYTTFDYDAVNAPGTVARSIDDSGNIVGTANWDDGSFTVLIEFERFADGSMHLIKNHRAAIHGVAGNISPHGVFAVEDWHDDLTVDGFLGKNGKIKSQLDLGFAVTRLRPRAATDAGDVTGFFRGNTSGYHGFLLSNGSTTVIDYPDANATGTELLGINRNGRLVGLWLDANGNEFGFTYDRDTAAFTPFVIPGYPNTSAESINKDGLIALQAYSADFTVTANYIYCPRKRSKCPAGGTEVRSGKTVFMPAGGLRQHGPGTAAKPAAAAVLRRQ